MRSGKRFWRAALLLGLGGTATAFAAAAGFETLSSKGGTVLTTCNPANSAGNKTCKVTSLPGETGYSLVATRSAPLIYNEVTIGRLQERVWRNKTQKDVYIFGARVVMNADQWDSSGLAFNVNDLFRQAKPGKAVSIGYSPDGATKALKRAGRTVQGQGEYSGQPERDNTWVDFRIDANAAEPSGASSASSPWLLTKTSAPQGILINALGIRILNAEFDDPLDAVDFFTAGYQPKGVPPPEDDDDGDDEGGGDDD